MDAPRRRGARPPSGSRARSGWCSAWARAAARPGPTGWPPPGPTWNASPACSRWPGRPRQPALGGPPRRPPRPGPPTPPSCAASPWPRPRGSWRRTGPPAPAWPRPAGPSWPPATACSPTATPGGWPPPASAPPSGSSTPRRRRGAGPGARLRDPAAAPGRPAHRLELVTAGIPVTVVADTAAGAPPWPAAWSTPSWSAATGWPPTATPPTRSAPTPWPCWPTPTASPSTWSGRCRRSTPRPPTAPPSRSSSARPPRSARSPAPSWPRGGRRLEPGLRRHPGRPHHRLRHRRRRPPAPRSGLHRRGPGR